MKKNILYAFITLCLVITSCSKDEPDHVHEHELITTMTITLTPSDASGSVTLQTQDLDADGPNAPDVTVSGNLKSGVLYNGAIVLLNETESPAENVTMEIEEEDKEHQFFFTVGSGLDITTEYLNFDSDGNPLGTKFSLIARSAGNGLMTVTLRHEPKKPNSGLQDAGGGTDLEASFNVTVE